MIERPPTAARLPFRVFGRSCVRHERALRRFGTGLGTSAQNRGCGGRATGLIDGSGVDVIVVGRDALGVDVCRRLKGAGSRVAAVWPADAPNLDEIEQLDVAHTLGDARRPPLLMRAGIKEARTLVAVTNDDQFNLRVALAARDLNPGIRIVIRQFNRRLGQKITNQLVNSEAVSPETHSAATYAASCLNRWVYHALEFPRYSEELVVFCRGKAADFGIGDTSVAEVRHRRNWQVLSIDEQRLPDDAAVIPPAALLTVACRLEAAPAAATATPRAVDAPISAPIQFERRRGGVAAAWRRMRIDPIFATLLSAMLVLILGATYFFHTAVGMTWIEAFYHVANTVTTTGSDTTAPTPTDTTRIVEIAVMLASVSIVGILIAYITAAITRRSIELAQGRHRVLAAGHVIVCGFGNVGSRVVQYLLHQGRRVAVIDRQPDPTLAGEARARGAHIMTADATSENALEMASVRRAAALLALTDSDSANIEIGLTASAYAPHLPVIMRIAEPSTAQAAERHFRIRASYSAAALAAPLVTGLALEPGSRGTVDVCGMEFALRQHKRSAALSERELLLAIDQDYMLTLRRA